MNELSVRGVYRRYIVEPLIEFLGTDDPAIVGDVKHISIANDILGSTTGWMRPALEPLAVKNVGPARWYQNVCDNIKGSLGYTQTWTHIDVRILLIPDSGVSASTISSLQATWKAGIEGTWNNPVQTPGGTPKQWKCGRPGEVPCRVSFKVHWVAVAAFEAYDHGVAVHPGSGATDEANWYTTDMGSVAAHEFGHMMGLPDEYTNPVSCSGRSPVNTGTIMDQNTNYIPQRLVQWVADEIGSDLE
jgi:hypothetical protein